MMIIGTKIEISVRVRSIILIIWTENGAHFVAQSERWRSSVMHDSNSIPISTYLLIPPFTNLDPNLFFFFNSLISPSLLSFSFTKPFIFISPTIFMQSHLILLSFLFFFLPFLLFKLFIIVYVYVQLRCYKNIDFTNILTIL